MTSICLASRRHLSSQASRLASVWSRPRKEENLSSGEEPRLSWPHPLPRPPPSSGSCSSWSSWPGLMMHSSICLDLSSFSLFCLCSSALSRYKVDTIIQ